MSDKYPRPLEPGGPHSALGRVSETTGASHHNPDVKPPRDSEAEGAAEPECGAAARGNDAICFTAGFSGATFGAGTIHAYLAADRKPPAVVAGISMGALTAAAMQRCYQELAKIPSKTSSHREVARWRWFRQYLSDFSDKPLNVVWNGLPKQSDFFADMPPVRDSTVPEYKDEKTGFSWREEEKTARRELYLFVKLGSWLATLPMTLSRLASFLVTYVRVKEKLPEWRLLRLLKYYFFSWICFLSPIITHICFSPRWFPEYKFRRSGKLKFPVRPLFGWRIFGSAWVILLLIIGGLLRLGDSVLLFFTATRGPYLNLLFWIDASAFGRFAARLASLFSWPWVVAWHSSSEFISLALYALREPMHFVFLALGACALFLVWFNYRKAFSGMQRTAINKFFQELLREVELEQALVYDFQLRLRLTRLFETDGKSPLLRDDPMPVLLVAAPLQKIEDERGPVAAAQLWPDPGTPLVDDLCAALAQPGLFRPLHLNASENPGDATSIQAWLSKGQHPDPPDTLDIVDGNVVRQNPIPALFTFLKDEKPELLSRLVSHHDDPRVHVVYNVPLQGQPGRNTCGPLGMNVVDVASISLQLDRRRDTLLEVQQTNFMSRLEEEVRKSGRKSSRRVNPIFADEIAPEKEISFKNPLNPSPEEILTKVAEGCRRSLETLYRKELKAFPCASEKVYCPSFLVDIAKDRRWIGYPEGIPGLPEVCSRCTKLLARPSEPKKRRPPSSLAHGFSKLTGKEPRIVFVASGGVFRGPFHGGMLACLLAAQIRPQMIIGASVGTLMGGALGALFKAASYPTSLRQLAEIIDVFLHVDQRVAFTKTLKSAAREIGIRARSIHLSPNKIRRIIRAGGRSDPGFAATGAPAALIDAISDLLMIPHKKTSHIAAKFVAGHVSEATRMLLSQMRTETLRRLEIEYAVIGTSLLEPTARKLLGLGGQINIDLGKAQPFLHDDEGIAFFGTTTDLVSERPRLLGRYNVPGGDGTYNFVEAALASSAFPGVFAPRRESEVFPGAGRTDVLLSDGGMFDNLPFIPAIVMLGDVQRVYRQDSGEDSIKLLRQRHTSPDLFIAGSLNVRPEMDNDAKGPFDDLITILQRAGSLQDNVKIRAFQDVAGLISGQLDLLLESVEDGTPVSDRDFIDGIVDATVLPVFPVDRDHLNPTFAFCASTGLKPKRVQRSIADGCFQTFGTIAEAQAPAPLRRDLKQAGRSVAKLIKLGRIPTIRWAGQSEEKASGKGLCPFFRHSADADKSQAAQKLVEKGRVSSFVCPFYAAGGPQSRAIYSACAGDPTHKDEAKLHRVRPGNGQETSLAV